MTLPDLEERVRQIRATGTGAGIGSSQSDETLTLVESALGVTLPAQYRAFVQRYGCLHIADVCVSGVGTRDPLEDTFANVVFATRNGREKLGLPFHLIVIRRDHEDHDHAICLDLGDAGGQPPVVCWDPSSKQTTFWYLSFDEFLEEHILPDWEDA